MIRNNKKPCKGTALPIGCCCKRSCEFVPCCLKSKVFYVNGKNDFPEDVPVANRFSTVIAAIAANNAIDGGGNTVYVTDGAYEGSFVITQPVCLIGQSRGAVIYSTHDGGSPRGIWISSSDVTVENLTIVGFDSTGITEEEFDTCIYLAPISPILFPGATPTPLKNVKIMNNDLQLGFNTNLAAGGDAGYGIVTQGFYDDSIWFTDILISNNRFIAQDETYGASRAVIINPGCANLLFTCNIIEGTYLKGPVFSGKNGDVVLMCNKFDGISDYSLLLYYGGGVTDASGNPVDWGDATVIDNEFSNYIQWPLYVYYTPIKNKRIVGNIFTNLKPGAIGIHQYLGADSPITSAPIGTCLNNTPQLCSGAIYDVGDDLFVDYTATAC